MMDIQIKEYLKYDEEEILNLYKSVGWKNYYDNPQIIKNAYKNSLCIMGAYLNDELVGVIRCVGDGYSIIYIQDIIVMPDYQHKGIGSLLIKDVLKKYEDVYQKVLLTDNKKETVDFYKSIGFNSADQYGCVSFMK